MRALRRMKLFATGLLVLATLIHLACRWAEMRGAGAWVGYVRAASEAGMVGALADWFAVTALFRHPLRLPIPHTAIIRRKKDQVGQALSGFVGDNFLDPELVSEKVRSAEIPRRAGAWLADEANAAKLSAEAGRLLANVLASLDEAEAAAVLDRMVIARLTEPDWGPPAGRFLSRLLDEDRDGPILQEIADVAHEKALGSLDVIDRFLGEKAPVWAPRFVNELVGEKVYRELVDLTWDIKMDASHPARLAVRRHLRRFADDLQNDPAMVAKVEGVKADLVTSAPMADAGLSLWRSVRKSLTEAAGDRESVLRLKIAETAVRYGRALVEDADLRGRVDRRITDSAAFVARNYAGEITSIISETVERWDADEAADKIELMVGRDLQFIRINGTLVGALAGLAIYSVSEALFTL